MLDDAAGQIVIVLRRCMMLIVHNPHCNCA